jgi:membrane-associated phospholipid phosphatase
MGYVRVNKPTSEVIGITISERQRRWLVLFVCCCVLVLADIAVVAEGWLQTLDGRVWLWFARTLGQRGFQLVEGISLAGVVKHSDRYLMLIAVAASLATAGFMARRRLAFTGALLVVTLTGCAAVVQVMKLAVDRSGPRLTPWTPLGHTFPSGTAAIAVAFFGFLGYVGYQRNRAPRRWFLVVLSTLACLSFILSALTYHYPTEVIGGVATGLGWLALMQIAFWDPLRRDIFARPPPASRRPMAAHGHDPAISVSGDKDQDGLIPTWAG